MIRVRFDLFTITKTPGEKKTFIERDERVLTDVEVRDVANRCENFPPVMPKRFLQPLRSFFSLTSLDFPREFSTQLCLYKNM